MNDIGRRWKGICEENGMSNATADLYRRRDAATVLGVSESQVLKFEHQGLLTAIPLPGLRAIRYAAHEVHGLAKRWIETRGESR
jgi:hypothetical protein